MASVSYPITKPRHTDRARGTLAQICRLSVRSQADGGMEIAVLRSRGWVRAAPGQPNALSRVG